MAYPDSITCECATCKRRFSGTPRGWSSIYCSLDCRPRQPAATRAEDPLRGLLSSGTRGAHSELRVAVDLMAQGFEVFRNLSPNGTHDIIALRGGKYFGIEVRTGTRMTTGMVSFPTHNIRAPYIAVVLPDEIIYSPALE